ncbi:DnaJ domain protein [Aspergillus lucknowensis]|uniref:DnaJ domain-containing protein n=1 Tax=Aspergillus lucknowensis TaxID=176173 RepID=A0ABR4LHC6_9EURO
MDCYEILGISPDATLKDINGAYKRLALKHHPDKAGTGGDDAALEFRKIQQAVEILRNPPTRKAHDETLGCRRRACSEEELLFSSPDYTGWRPHSMFRSNLSRRDRYMYSYGNSVHMDPYSKESQEEKARCSRASAEEEQEEARRVAEDLQEQADLEMQGGRESSIAGSREKENKRFGLNPESDPFEVPEGNAHAEWWAGAEPERAYEASFRADIESTDEGTENYFEAEHEEDSEIELRVEVDVDGGNTVDTKGPGFKADTYATVGPDAASDTGKHKVDTESEVEPTVNLELGPEYHAEFDISSIIATVEAEANPVNTTDAAAERVDVHTSSPEQFTAEYRTASQGSLPDLYSGVYMMSGGLGSGLPLNEESCHEPAKSGSDASIYYDFSAEAPSQPRDTENSATAQTYDLMLDDAKAYPHLAPFIPYFTAKLAHRSGRYTKHDLQVELKGMIMETYCGWLETLRATIPGAESFTSLLDPDSQSCRHLGYWEKGYGHDECDRCHLWKPIYTLVCPGCGIKRCVGCKFDCV